MATNPMQRKARNSFLIGMLLTLLITGIIIAFLFIQLTNAKKEQKQKEQANPKSKVYALVEDKKSGDKLDYGCFYEILMDTKLIPENAVVSLGDLFGNEGELICKIDMAANTVITPNMVVKSTEKLTDDVRIQEYNMISLQTGIENGDYVDIRFMTPSGQDFIVLSKKKVTIPVGGDYLYVSDTIRMELSENETLLMSSAIVESWKLKGSKIYATKYVEAGMQTAAKSTYLPNGEVWEQIKTNPNIVNEAKTALNDLYNAQVNIRQNYINSELSKQSQDLQTNLEEGLNESIVKTKEDRENYLNTLVPMY